MHHQEQNDKNNRNTGSYETVTNRLEEMATLTDFVILLHIAIPVATNGLLSSRVSGGGEGHSDPPHSLKGRTGLLLSRAHTLAH